jgi:cysteine-rich repeat protein
VLALFASGCAVVSGLTEFEVDGARTSVGGGGASSMGGGGSSMGGGGGCDGCEHVTGVVHQTGQQTAEVGNAGAMPPFTDECPPSTLLVGMDFYDGGDIPEGSQHVAQLTPHCAQPQLVGNAFGWMGTVAGATHGYWSSGNSLQPTLRCPSDEFVVGFQARTDDNTQYPTAIALHCAPLTFVAGTVVIGTAISLVGPSGSTVGTTSPSIYCLTDSVAAAVTGSDGALVDRIGLRCDTLAPALCGDGSVNGSEACDDGNTADGDGCSAACANE